LLCASGLDQVYESKLTTADRANIPVGRTDPGYWGYVCKRATQRHKKEDLALEALNAIRAAGPSAVPPDVVTALRAAERLARA
jgi:hypothetical protein